MSRWDTPEAVRQLLESSEVVAAVECARSLPNAHEDDFVDEPCARRYLRANEGNVQAAAAVLAATLHWRLKERPKEVECPACRQDPHSHNMRVVGVDRFERPVIYTDFSQAIHRFHAEDAMQHLMRTLEDACAIQASRLRRGLAQPQRDAEPEANVWIIDFHGYGLWKDSNPRMAVMAGRMLTHYPERLGRCLLVDAPRFFAATWAAVSKVINATTAAKVAFARTDDGSLAEDLHAWAPGPLSDWLMSEVRENRLPQFQKGEKEYWRAVNAAGSPHAHDPRGLPEFVASPEFVLTLTSRLAAPKGVFEAAAGRVAESQATCLHRLDDVVITAGAIVEI